MHQQPDQAATSTPGSSPGWEGAVVSVWGHSLRIPGAGGKVGRRRMRGDGRVVRWGGLTCLLTSAIPAIPALPPLSGCLGCPDACPRALGVTAACSGSGEEPAEGMTHQTSNRRANCFLS